MYQKKLDSDLRCPLEYALELLRGKWRPRILCELGYVGSMHFGELKSSLPGISDGVLANTLSDLIASGLLCRGTAASVGYTLTEKGRSLLPLLGELCRWASAYYTPEDLSQMQRCAVCTAHLSHQNL